MQWLKKKLLVPISERVGTFAGGATIAVGALDETFHLHYPIIAISAVGLDLWLAHHKGK